MQICYDTASTGSEELDEAIRKVEKKRFEKILNSQHEVEIEPNLNKLARENFEGVLGLKRFRRSTLYFADRLIDLMAKNL